MSGATADEGAKVIADLLYLGSSADRGSSLQLGLFTNSASLAALKALPLSSIVEPTGGGYARKTLTNASWTGSTGTRAYALQTFTVTTTNYTGQVYGYFIATTGSTPRLLHIEIDPAGPYTLNVGDTYDVTLNTITA